MGAIAGAELGRDIVDVLVGGPGRHAELGADLGGGEAFGRELHHLTLARGELHTDIRRAFAGLAEMRERAVGDHLQRHLGLPVELWRAAEARNPDQFTLVGDRQDGDVDDIMRLTGGAQAVRTGTETRGIVALDLAALDARGDFAWPGPQVAGKIARPPVTAGRIG